MNLYRYYQHDGFRCETTVGIVKAKDMQEAEKIVKTITKKHIEENSSEMVGNWKKLSFPMMDAAKFITGD